MTVTRRGRLKRATALVPLALLSAAWTVSISTTGATEASAGGSRPRLPDGTSVPGEALTIPASVSTPAGSALGVTGESSSRIVSTSSASSIPSAALAAYQRAETVINKADRSCRLPWQLLAAIGRVESDHGRANGNRLSAAGVSSPGVFGKALDGSAGTSRIVDTDGGQYDGDTRLDRAVGPMQFIPATWSTVGVDADGDGQRNPQDIDDAALAAAVYLCSGTDDLSTPAGRSAAVFRYNHSASYVATVLAVLQSYLAGDYTAAPDATIPATSFEPGPTTASSTRPTKGRHQQQHTQQPHQPSGVVPSSPASSTPAAPSTPAGGGGGTKGGGGTPTHSPTPTPTPTPTVEEPVKAVVASVQQLTTVCTNALTARYDGLSGGDLQQAVGKCVAQLGGKTLPEAQAAVGGVVAGLAGFVSGLLGGLVGGLLGH